MLVLDHPKGDYICPVCGKGGDKPVAMIGINGTEDSSTMAAHLYHLECLAIVEVQIGKETLLMQRVKRRGG